MWTTVLSTFAAAFVVSAAGLWLLSRLLPPDYLVAGVNDRSNHTQPARQIGGLAVIPGVIAGLAAGLPLGQAEPRVILAAAAGALLLLAVGHSDDRRDLPVLPRLAGQAVAAGLVMVSLGPELRVLPEFVPLTAERVAAALFLVWFVNLTNFMDGLDLMVVTGIGLPHALLALLGGLSLLSADATLLCAAVAGGLAGFAPGNTPPARIFLGDSGSLPVGLLTGTVIYIVACGNPAAALMPFLFFFADSTSVLVERLVTGQNVLRAHSTHAYQRARRGGKTVRWIVARVALLSILCGALAAAALAMPPATGWLPLCLALAATGALIMWLRNIK